MLLCQKERWKTIFYEANSPPADFIELLDSF